MKQIWWIIVLGLGVFVMYTPKFNITLSLGSWIIVLGILGLIKSLFSSNS
ncbi:MAG: hypothetical protein KGH93_01290 [Patescibacteria group bacterium]|nr:hypothetical protein [Patescibacteria group bacterium]MDE1945816.1 hypothetical protein [Patescibacteria group bacterium]